MVDEVVLTSAPEIVGQPYRRGGIWLNSSQTTLVQLLANRFQGRHRRFGPDLGAVKLSTTPDPGVGINSSPKAKGAERCRPNRQGLA
jgi:hypothetical protein